MNKLILSLLFFSTINSAFAQKDDDFDKYIKDLKTEITQKGYDPTILDKVFNNNFEQDVRIKTSLKNQPEVKFSFNKYFDSKITPWRINQGAMHYKENIEQLKKIEAKYKVDPQVLIALWGLETNYGTYPLGHNAFKALVNIAYTHHSKSRRDYFKSELFALFEVTKINNFNPTEIKSSWAGALGQCQFMPSNVLNYGIDWNNDGKADIWNTKVDVFASSANFIHKLGWTYKTSNIQEVTIPKGYNILAKREFKSIAIWQKEGFKFKNKNLNVNDKMKLFAPLNQENKVFLVSKNFDIIKKWNNSDYFAFSVLTLADEIKNTDK